MPAGTVRARIVADVDQRTKVRTRTGSGRLVAARRYAGGSLVVAALLGAAPAPAPAAVAAADAASCDREFLSFAALNGLVGAGGAAPAPDAAIWLAWLDLIDPGLHQGVGVQGLTQAVLRGLPSGASFADFAARREALRQGPAPAAGAAADALARARARVRQALRGTAPLAAWRRCMERQATGLRIVLDEDEPEGAVASVLWDDPRGGGPAATRLRATTAGGRLHPGESGAPWGRPGRGRASLRWKARAGEASTLFLTRDDAAGEIRLTIEAAGAKQVAVSLPPAPRAEPAACARPGARPLSLGAPVTVSGSRVAAERITDGLLDNGYWSAEGPPSQWVEIDLGAERNVRRLRLVPQQTPDGITHHRIHGARAIGPTFFLAESKADTRSGRPFTVDVPAGRGSGLRWIRVETVMSPSWVAWREIEVLGCEPAPGG